MKKYYNKTGDNIVNDRVEVLNNSLYIVDSSFNGEKIDLVVIDEIKLSEEIT